LYAVLVPVAAFLSGSVPWSHVIAKSRGVDLRKVGSGNIGATNLFRACGRLAGILGLLLDVAKGALPVLAAVVLELGTPVTALTALAAVAGHVFSPWMGFRGGKGVATGLGAFVVFAPLPVLTALAVFLVSFAISRIVSLSSILAASALVPASWLLSGGDDGIVVPAVCTLLAAIILARHRSNIARLLSGSEGRLRRGGGN